MRLERTLIAVALLGVAATGWTQAWSPQRNVEIVVGFAPGGGGDRTARTVERILAATKLVHATITVANKPGGGSIAYSYANQRPGDGHTLVVVGSGLISNHIMGSSALNYTDFTPIASLLNDYSVFAVNADSPIRTGNDLVERLKKDPKSVTTGIAGIGAAGHLSAAMLHKAIGGNPRDVKGIVFKSGAESSIGLLGGHIELALVSGGTAAPHVAAGRMRVVAVAAPKCLGGVLTGVPNWREQDVEVEISLWRMVIGPKGMTPAQIVYWENVLRKVTETAEWKADIEENHWSDNFVPGTQFRKDLERSYADLKSILTDLGLARQ